MGLFEKVTPRQRAWTSSLSLSCCVCIFDIHFLSSNAISFFKLTMEILCDICKRSRIICLIYMGPWSGKKEFLRWRCSLYGLCVCSDSERTKEACFVWENRNPLAVCFSTSTHHYINIFMRRLQFYNIAPRCYFDSLPGRTGCCDYLVWCDSQQVFIGDERNGFAWQNKSDVRFFLSVTATGGSFGHRFGHRHEKLYIFRRARGCFLRHCVDCLHLYMVKDNKQRFEKVKLDTWMLINCIFV